MVVVMKMIDINTPNMGELYRFCTLLSLGEMDKSKLYVESYLDPFWGDVLAEFLLQYNLIKADGVRFSLTEKGKVFVEKMADVYKFMLSENY
jgi:predicted transcriptional regulator